MDIASYFPGRIRVSSKFFTIQENMDMAAARLHAAPGIKEVTGSLRTGSLTIVYDPKRISQEMLLDAKKQIEEWELQA